MMSIKHNPIFDTAKVEQLYTEKDGVDVRYVCTSALGGEARAMDIFYRETPHPEFGNRYFGIFGDHLGRIMITNADRIEDVDFGMIQDENGDFHYSAHRHDCKLIGEKMIDGGRAYIHASSGDYVVYKVRNGKFVR